MKASADDVCFELLFFHVKYFHFQGNSKKFKIKKNISSEFLVGSGLRRQNKIVYCVLFLCYDLSTGVSISSFYLLYVQNRTIQKKKTTKEHPKALS